MENIKTKTLKTAHLTLKIPTFKEQKELWNILKDEQVNRYYFPTPDRIFRKYNLKKDKVEDLIEVRKIFQTQLNDWKRQEPFYNQKIINIQKGNNSQKFTWSIFLKNTVIGQMTVQPCDEHVDNPSIRDVGWFISPKHQRKGYAYEAAKCILDYMFLEVQIEKIITSAACINIGSWKIMEKLGFERIGKKRTTYLDDNNNILNSYCYEITRTKYLQFNNLKGGK